MSHPLLPQLPESVEEYPAVSLPGVTRTILVSAALYAALFAPRDLLPPPLWTVLGALAALSVPGLVLLSISAISGRVRALGGLERFGLVLGSSLLAWSIAGLLAFLFLGGATAVATAVVMGLILLTALCAGSDPTRLLRMPQPAAASSLVLGAAAAVTAALVISPTLPPTVDTGSVSVALAGDDARAASSGGLQSPALDEELGVSLQLHNPAAQRRTFVVSATMPWGTVWTEKRITVPAGDTQVFRLHGEVPEARCVASVTVRVRDAERKQVTGDLTVPVKPRPDSGICPIPLGTDPAAAPEEVAPLAALPTGTRNP